MLLIGASLLAAAGILALALLVVLRRTGAADRGRSAQLAARRAPGQLRRLNRLARRIERRLKARTDRLRELLDRAERLTARLDPLATGLDVQGDGLTPDLPLERQRDQIFRLSFQGLEPMDIARKLDLPVGEVEVTLNLHKSQHGAGRGLADDQP